MERHDADVIIIGSGMGALTAGALLAKLHGRRVLILERHFRAGGFTHTFSRPGGFTWDVGVHYVGEVNAPSLMQKAMQVATDGKLQWAMMPEGYDVLRFPGLEFTFRTGSKQVRSDLKAAFPDEAAAIDQYWADVATATRWTPMLGFRGLLPRPIFSAASALFRRPRQLAAMTTKAWLDAHVRDERLKAVLGARWGDLGPSPAHSSFLANAVIARHYLEGATYPVGGAGRILATTKEVIEAAGGEIRVNAAVSRIIVERNRAVGVQLEKGEILKAPVIISNAGARATYTRLLGDEVPLPFRAEIEGTPRGMAHISVYLGLSASAATLGHNGANLWLHDSLDHDVLARDHSVLTGGRMTHGAVFFPSMKDPEARTHTVEVVIPADAKLFAEWQDRRWMRRGDEYAAVKARLADAVIARVDRELPGLARLVVAREVSTPLTTEHFTGHAGGEIYGLPATPERFDKAYCGSRTIVPGLFLVGADALFLGIGGALISGAMTTAAIAGWKTFGLLSRRAAALPSPIVPAVTTKAPLLAA